MIGPGTGVRVYLACGVTDMRNYVESAAGVPIYSIYFSKLDGSAGFLGRHNCCLLSTFIWP